MKWLSVLLLSSFFSITILSADSSGTPPESDSTSRPPKHIPSNAPDQGNLPEEEDHGLLRGDQYDYLDHAKNSVYLTFAENLQILDSVLSDGTLIEDETFHNRIRLMPYLVYQESASSDYQFKLDYFASIRLRRLEKRLSLIIDTGDLAPLPNTQPNEEDNDPQIGLQKRILKGTSVKVGGKVRWPPVGYVIGTWSQSFQPIDWQMIPKYSVFYQTDEDGFGTGANFLLGRWWDPIMLKSDTGFRITEATTGIEWASSVTLAHVWRLIEPADRRPLVSARSYNEGIDLIYRISGHISGHKTIDEHRVIANYRHPLRKNWLFFFVSPELFWQRENNWAPEFRLRVGIDALFWGVTR